jgi:hypothetical protein
MSRILLAPLLPTGIAVIFGGAVPPDGRSLTMAIKHTIHRVPKPRSRGTCPSGGTSWAILVYGLIPHLLRREFSGRRRTAKWHGAVAAALGFSEGDSRDYPRLHQFTDTLGGLVYDGLLLFVPVTGMRGIGAPVAGPGQDAPLLHPALAHGARAPVRR